MAKNRLTVADIDFLKDFSKKPRHSFRELVYYVKVKEKLTK